MLTAPKNVRRHRVSILSSATVALVLACSESIRPVTTPDAAADAGEDDAAVEDVSDASGSCALPASYGSAACNTCVRASCCDVIVECESDPACKPLAKCITDCLPNPDAGGCRNGCLQTYPSGKTLWDKVYGCWFGEPPKGCLTKCT